MATMRDIAREAGVSQGTVSAVINGNPTVKADNVRKVMSACEKLGYVPNIVARAMRTGRSQQIGLLIPDICNPYYPEFARGVEDAAAEAGYHVFLCNVDRSLEKERSEIKSLMARQVDGVLLVKTQLPVEELREIRKRCGCVIFEPREAELDDFDMVDADCRSGAEAAVKSLLELGHRRIAYVGGRMDSIGARERFNGYKAQLAEHGVTVDESLIRWGDYSLESGYMAAEALLWNEERPTAIFAANDVMALGILKRLAEQGIQVPQDISVVGFDDITMASYSTPALSTVHISKYAMGRRGFEILQSALQEPDKCGGSHIHLNTTYVARESVAPCRGG